MVLSDPATGEIWSARVSALLPTADPAGRLVRLLPDRAPPVGRPLVAEWLGMPTSGVWVPRGAVVDTGSRQVVFVEAAAKGRFSPRSVVIGRRTADEVQVARGVDPGERVVVSGTFLLDAETQMGSVGHAGHGK